jgi:tetratricopeptide (TPR) repeat protein|uniref:tetratricopeptide repeat protein n=1 Tax=Cephaloticoccus sp. TaxID=1985742 RepID=UPI00404A6EEA
MSPVESPLRITGREFRLGGVAGWVAGTSLALTLWVQTAPGLRGSPIDGESNVTQPIDTDPGEGDEAYAQAEHALATATDERTKLQAMAALVNLQRRRGDYTTGLAMAREGLEQARTLGDKRLEVEFLYLMGRMHWNLADYPRSIETHLEELKLVPALGNDALLARTHVALGLTYERFGNRDDARTHFDIALRLAQTAGDQRQLASILNSLGNYFLAEQDFPRARELHRQALSIREALGQRRAIADSLTNLGLVADAQGDSAQALVYLEQALAIYQPLKLRRYIANTHRRLATVMRGTSRTAEALTHLDQAYEIAVNLGSAEVLGAIYQEYAATHEARGQFADALAYERKLTASNEEMRGDQDRQRMSELRAHYNANWKSPCCAAIRI